jgi:signal peptidase I
LENNNKEEKSNGELIEWIKSIGTAILIAILIKTFIFNTTYVLGNSMYPTLHRGDVVVLEAPDNTNKDYIKRVIGVAGDKVEIVDGKVYVNDELLEEDYIEVGSFTHIYNESSWIVPEGQLFVLGDNREEGASKDSRYFGCITIDSIKGITGFRYFPFDNRFGKIR